MKRVMIAAAGAVVAAGMATGTGFALQTVPGVPRQCQHAQARLANLLGQLQLALQHDPGSHRVTVIQRRIQNLNLHMNKACN